MLLCLLGCYSVSFVAFCRDSMVSRAPSREAMKTIFKIAKQLNSDSGDFTNDEKLMLTAISKLARYLIPYAFNLSNKEIIRELLSNQSKIRASCFIK